MKPIVVKSSTQFDFGVERNDKNPEFEVGGHGRISKFKIICTKSYTSNWSEKSFVIPKYKKKLYYGDM